MAKQEYQVTLMANNSKYKPVSCIVSIEQELGYDMTKSKARKKEIIDKGIIKIAQKRYWTNKDLVKYGYTKVRVRLYDKEKIEQENKLRYEQIKEQHYADGTWQRPKEK